MESWNSFIQSIQSISLEESKEKLQEVILGFPLPDGYRDVISSAAILLLEGYKTNKTSHITEALKTVQDVESSCKNENRFDVCFYTGSILFGYSKLFPDDGQTKVNLLQNAADYFVKATAVNSKHLESLQNLHEIYGTLANITQENQQMYYSTKQREISKYIGDIVNGVETKLPPSTLAKIAQAYAFKDEATEYFKKGEFQKAVTKYHFSKNYITGLMDLSEEKEKEVNELKLNLLNNIAVCLMKLGKYQQAIKSLNEVLQTDPSNVKALFRRGKSNTNLQNYDQAQDDLARACSLKPDDVEIQNEIKILNAKSKIYREKQSAAYSKMFSSEQ